MGRSAKGPFPRGSHPSRGATISPWCTARTGHAGILGTHGASRPLPTHSPSLADMIWGSCGSSGCWGRRAEVSALPAPAARRGGSWGSGSTHRPARTHRPGSPAGSSSRRALPPSPRPRRPDQPPRCSSSSSSPAAVRGPARRGAGAAPLERGFCLHPRLLCPGAMERGEPRPSGRTPGEELGNEPLEYVGGGGQLAAIELPAPGELAARTGASRFDAHGERCCRESRAAVITSVSPYRWVSSSGAPGKGSGKEKSFWILGKTS